MTEYILKVKVFLPKNSLDIFYHSFSTERLGLCFCLTKFKNCLRQRFEVLNNARFKMVWVDNEGDRISILDEVDLHLVMEMKATEVLIEVDFMNSIEKKTNIDFPILSRGFQNITTVRGSRDTSFEMKSDRGQFCSSAKENMKATSRHDDVTSSDCSSLRETKTITSIEPNSPMKISPHRKLIAPDTPMEITQVTQSFSGDDKSLKEFEGNATIVNRASPMSSSSGSYSLSEKEEKETSSALKTPTKRSPHEKHISLKHRSSSEKEKTVTSFVTPIAMKIAHEKIPSYSSEGSSSEEDKGKITISPITPTKRSTDEKMITPDATTKRTQKIQLCSSDISSSQEEGGKAIVVNKTLTSSSSYSSSEEKEERETLMEPKTMTQISPNEKHESARLDSSLENEKSITSDVTSYKLYDRFYNAMKSISLPMQATNDEKLPLPSFEEKKGRTLVLREQITSNDVSSSEEEGEVMLVPETPTKVSSCHHNHVMSSSTEEKKGRTLMLREQIISNDGSSSEEEGEEIFVPETPTSSIEDSSSEETEQKTSISPKTPMESILRERHISPKRDSSFEEEKTMISITPTIPMEAPFVSEILTQSAFSLDSSLEEEEGRTYDKTPLSSPTKRSPHERHISRKYDSLSEEEKSMTSITPIIPIEATHKKTTPVTRPSSNDKVSSQIETIIAKALFVPEILIESVSSLDSSLEEEEGKSCEKRRSSSPTNRSPHERNISLKHDSSSEEENTMTSITKIIPIKATHEKTTPMTPPSSNDYLSSLIETIIAKAPFVHERLIQSAFSLDSSLEDEEGRTCEKKRSSSPTKRSPNERHISPKHDFSSQEENTMTSITPIIPIEATHEKTNPVTQNSSNDKISSLIKTIIAKAQFVPEMLTQSASSLDSSLEKEEGRTYENNRSSSPTKTNSHESHISTTHDSSSEEEKSMKSITPIPIEATLEETTPVTPPSSDDKISSRKETIIASSPFVPEILTQSASSLDSSLEEEEGRTYEKNPSSEPTKTSPHESYISTTHNSSSEEEKSMSSITPIPIEATLEETTPVTPPSSDDKISSQKETIIASSPFVPKILTQSASSLDSSLEEEEGRIYEKNPSSSPTKASSRATLYICDSSSEEENCMIKSTFEETTPEETTPVTPPSPISKTSPRIGAIIARALLVPEIIASSPFVPETLTQSVSSLGSSLEEEEGRTYEKNPSSSPTKISPHERHASSSEEEEANPPIQTKQITSSNGNSTERRKTLILMKMPSFLRDDIPDEEEMMKRLSSAPSSSKTDHTKLKKLEEKEMDTSSSKQKDEKTSTSPSKERHTQKPTSSDGSSLAEGEENTSASSNEQPVEYLMKVSSENSANSSDCTSTFAVLQLETLEKLEKSKEEMEVSGENLSCSSDNSSTFEELKPPTVEKYSSLESLNEEMPPEKSSKDDSFLSDYSVLSDDSDYAECE